MKTIRAIIIDAEWQKVREEQIEKSLEGMQKVVGGLIERAAVLQPSGDDLYVDEEGLYHGYKFGFMFLANREQLLVGNGLIVGHDGKGNSCDAKSTVEEIQKRVKFLVSPSDLD